MTLPTVADTETTPRSRVWQWLRVAVPLAVIGLVAVACAALLKGRRGTAALVAAAVVLLVAPAVWSASGVREAQDGNAPLVRPGATASADFVRSDQPPVALLTWLDSRRGPATWIVGVGSSFAAQSPIVAGYRVVALGGYIGQDGAASIDRVAPLVATGKLRYLYLGGGGFGSRGGEVGRLTDAVQRSCPVVGPSVWGGESGFGATLYDCAGRAEALRSEATRENRG